MATAFDVAMSAIFADGNMATPATYRAGGYGLAVTVPVLMRAPDLRQTWNAVAISSASVVIEVQVATIAAPASGDTFTIGATEYVVQGTPERDAAQLVWVIELVEHT
jgi:hypothetical protein